MCDILDDHVHVDGCIRQRPEDAGHHAGPIRHADQRDLGFVAVIGHAGNQFLLHDFILIDNERARFVGEARQHLNAHLFLHRQLDRAGLQHLGTHRCQLQHFLIGNFAQLAGARHDAGIGGEHALHIGVDVTPIGLQGGGNRDCRGIRSAAPKCCDAAIVCQALKAGDDRDFAGCHGGVQAFHADIADARLAVAFRCAHRQLPAEPGTGFHSGGLQHDGEKTRCHLLAGGDHHIIFRRIGERRCFAAKADQPIGFARHGRHHHRHPVAGVHLALHACGNAADALDPRHGRSAEFHHD